MTMFLALVGGLLSIVAGVALVAGLGAVSFSWWVGWMLRASRGKE